MNKQKKNQTYQYREQNYDCQKEGGSRMGKMGEGEWEIQAFSYGMNKSQG